MNKSEVLSNLGSNEQLLIGGYFYAKKSWSAKTIKWGCVHKRKMGCKGSVTTSNKYPYKNQFNFIEHSHPASVIIQSTQLKLASELISNGDSCTLMARVENVNKQSIGNLNNKEKSTTIDKTSPTVLPAETVKNVTTMDTDTLIKVTSRMPYVTLTRITQKKPACRHKDEKLSLTKSSGDVTYGRTSVSTVTSTTTTTCTSSSVTPTSVTSVPVMSTSTVTSPSTVVLPSPDNSTAIKVELDEDIPESTADIDLPDIDLPERNQDIEDIFREQFMTHDESFENMNHYNNKKRKLDSNSNVEKDKNSVQNCAAEDREPQRTSLQEPQRTSLQEPQRTSLQEPQRTSLTELLDRAQLLDLNVRNIPTEDIRKFCSLNPTNSDPQLPRPVEPCSAGTVEQLDLEQRLRIFYLKTIIKKEDELMDLKLEINRIQLAKDKMEIDHKKEAHLLRMENMNLEKKFWKLRMQLMAS